MSTQTDNLKLNKVEYADAIRSSITAYNDNFDIIDLEITNFKTDTQANLQTINEEVAKKANATDLVGLATQSYVDEAIDALDIPEDVSDYATKDYVDDAIAEITIPNVPEITVDTAPSLTSANPIANNAITGLVHTADRYNEPSVTESNGVQILSLDLPLASYDKGKIIKIKTSNLPDGIKWTQRTSMSSGSTIYDVCYGNGLFVAVGQSGKIHTSLDGMTWAQQTSGVTTDLQGVCYEREQFVAVGISGTIITSPDGITWAAQTSGVSVSLEDICYGNGLYVAVGSSGTIITSPDGITWVAQTNPRTDSVKGIIYDGSQFVAIDSGGYILTSPDGTTWEAKHNGLINVGWDICYGNGLYVIGSTGILTSSDGVNWTRALAMNRNMYGVCYGNGVFVVTSVYGCIYTSADGVNWKETRLYDSNNVNFQCAYCANGLYVVAGKSNLIFTSPAGNNSVTNAKLNINSLGETTINGTLEYAKNYTLIYNGASWNIENQISPALKQYIDEAIANALASLQS